MEANKGEVLITDGFPCKEAGVAVSNPAIAQLSTLESDAAWLSLLHVDQLEELFSATAAVDIQSCIAEESTSIPKPAALLKSRTLELLQKWLEAASTADPPTLVQAPLSPMESVTTSPLFSDLDLGSPRSFDESSVFSSAWLTTPLTTPALDLSYTFGNNGFVVEQPIPLSQPTPPSVGRTMEIACQTELTMSDFDAKPSIHHTSRLTSLSRSNSPAARRQRMTPETTEEPPSDDEDDAPGPDFSACKTPEEILSLILKTKQNRHDHLYHCPSCDRAFSRRFNLKTHYAGTHCNVRNFSCSSCDRAFSRRYDLQRHEKLVHKLECPASPSGGAMRGSRRR